MDVLQMWMDETQMTDSLDDLIASIHCEIKIAKVKKQDLLASLMEQWAAKFEYLRDAGKASATPVRRHLTEREKLILGGAPLPGDFGIPVEHCNTAKDYALAYHAHHERLRELQRIRSAERPEPVTHDHFTNSDHRDDFGPVIDGRYVLKSDYDALCAIAEADRARVKNLEEVNSNLADTNINLAESVRELEAEREAMMADAKRYRWLRDVTQGAPAEKSTGVLVVTDDPQRHPRYIGPLSGKHLDAAIDKAMTAAMGVE